MKEHVQRLFYDSLHGGLLKSIALAARLLFFVLVIPRLPDGVLSGYVFANSVAVMGATILMLGLDEELPRVIAGNALKARVYMPTFFVLSGLGLAGLAVLTLFPSANLAILVLLLAVSAGRILAGIIRSIDPHINEQIQNWPWVAFIAIVVFFKLDETVSLIAVMAGSLLLIQYLGAYLVLRKSDRLAADSPIALDALIRHGLVYGSSRLISNFLLLGIIRGPILWPVWLGLHENLDQVAFAIAVGDILIQFGRIPANHAYARWCRFPPMLRSDWQSAVISTSLLATGLFVFSSMAFMLAGELGWLPKQGQNVGLQIQALLLSAMIPGVRMLIYLLWSRGILGAWLASILFVMLMFSIAIIYLIDINYWFYALAFVTATGATMMAFKSRYYFELSTPEIVR